MEFAHKLERGALGLEGEMIDAPMVKQVLWIAWCNKHETDGTQAGNVIQAAKAAGISIPQVEYRPDFSPFTSRP